MNWLSTTYKSLWREVPNASIALLLILIFLSSCSESIGILLLVPMIELLGKAPPEQTAQSAILFHYIRNIFDLLEISINITSLLGIFILLIGLRCVIQFYREQLSIQIQYQFTDRLRLQCFQSLMDAQWRWLSTKNRSDDINLLLSNISRSGIGLYAAINLLSSTATLCAYLIAAFTLSWNMAFLALLGGISLLFLLKKQKSAAFLLGQKLSTTSNALHAIAQNSLTGLKLSKILGIEAHHTQQFRNATEDLRNQQLQFSRSSNFNKFLLQFGGALFLSLYLYAGFKWWHIPTPTLLILILIFSRLIPQFSATQHFHYLVLQALPALHDICKLLADGLEHAEPKTPSKIQVIPLSERIELNQVTVHYEGRNNHALNQISVCIPARKTTAIIGESGAGKSTLADLLMGLISPDAGTIKVDGILLDQQSRQSWRKWVAYVPQEVFLLHGSIRDNLLWGNLEASDTQLIEALKRAHAQFVLQLPNGLDTMIGEGGSLLSGGERQRIVLARALLKNPTLLILDEATSALDPNNESSIQQALKTLSASLTVVIISHRLSILDQADQVITLREGALVSSLQKNFTRQ